MNVEDVTPERTLTNYVYLALLLIALVVPFVLESFWRYVTILAIAYTLFAVAYNLLYGYTGLLSLGHAVYFGFGAYAPLILIQHFDVGFLPGMLVGAIVAGVVAIGFGFLAVRIESHGFVIITIIALVVVRLVSNSVESVSGGTAGLAVTVPPLSAFGLEIPLSDSVFTYYFALAITVVCITFITRLVNSPLGLTFRMIRDDEMRAKMLGYPTFKYKLASFAMSGFFSAIAGSLFVLNNSFISIYIFNIEESATPLIMTILGGRGTMLGPIIGAIFYEFFTHWIKSFTEYHAIVIGSLLVAVLLINPDGLIDMTKGLLERTRRYRTDRSDDAAPQAGENE